jgi:uncharacterized protein (DUF427 family)
LIQEQTMVKAMWNDEVIAESNETVMVEGNHYFPLHSVREEFLRPSDYSTTCAWKGKASYYSLDVNGQQNRDAVWFYAEPKRAAAQIKDHVAFWRGVTISE